MLWWPRGSQNSSVDKWNFPLSGWDRACVDEYRQSRTLWGSTPQPEFNVRKAGARESAMSNQAQ